MGMSVDPVRHRFSVDDYHRMGDADLFGPEARLELLGGEIIEMSPIGQRHAGCVNRLNSLLSSALGDRAVVAVQNPLRLGDDTELQPDLAVLKPRPDFYSALHPRPEDALLVIEVADTTLRWDRTAKRPLYAAAGIVETWIVDLAAGALEVATDPATAGYATVRRLAPAETVRAMAVPDLSLRVAAILG